MSFTDEQISTFDLSEITTFLEDKGENAKLLDSSLNQWRAKYIEGANGADYYFLIDGNGNIFKSLLIDLHGVCNGLIK